MEELELLQKLGLNSHVEIIGAAIVVSYIVKLFYSAHIQRLIRDTIRFLHMTFSPQSNVPTLYEMLPRQYQ